MLNDFFPFHEIFNFVEFHGCFFFYFFEAADFAPNYDFFDLCGCFIL